MFTQQARTGQCMPINFFDSHAARRRCLKESRAFVRPGLSWLFNAVLIRYRLITAVRHVFNLLTDAR